MGFDAEGRPDGGWSLEFNLVKASGHRERGEPVPRWLAEEIRIQTERKRDRIKAALEKALLEKHLYRKEKETKCNTES